MRGTFIQTLVELAEQDERILVLAGDLGYMAVEPFAERFPERFLNVGVAEQNMVGLATGLAEADFIPFVYSIVTFATLRPYEFIRNGPILHQLPVRIVGVSGGVENGHNGPTHYGLEDVGVMRVQPGITVIAPADYQQARSALQATWHRPGPVYYLLGKDEHSTVPGLNGKFALAQVQLIGSGSEVLMVAMGSVASEAVAAAQALGAQGIDCGVAIVASLNPAPQTDLATILARVPLVLSVEPHYAVGGVGSLVAEIIAEHGLNCRLVRCGTTATPDGISGSQGYLYERYGLSRNALFERAIAELHCKSYYVQQDFL